MDNATATAIPGADTALPAATIRPEEAAHFGRLAAEWWDPKGSSAMLHKLNPVRLGFIREAIDAHFQSDTRSLKPLAGRRVLDAGCGAGLLCEPLARLGGAVTGVDAAPENIAAASAHAAQAGLAIDYRCGELASLGLAGYDLVCSLEVLEHVADKGAFLKGLTSALAPEGLMILSAPNRTTRSRLLLVEGAERLGMVPRGTHDWSAFPTPGELAELAAEVGLELGTPRGIAWSPTQGLHLSDDLALDFIVTARHA